MPRVFDDLPQATIQRFGISGGKPQPRIGHHFAEAPYVGGDHNPSAHHLLDGGQPKAVSSHCEGITHTT